MGVYLIEYTNRNLIIINNILLNESNLDLALTLSTSIKIENIDWKTVSNESIANSYYKETNIMPTTEGAPNMEKEK